MQRHLYTAMANQRLEILLGLYMQGEITGQELSETWELLATAEDGDIDTAVSQMWKEYTGAEDISVGSNKDQILGRILGPGQAPVHRVHFLKRGWVRYAAAVLLIVGPGALWFVGREVPVQLVALQADVKAPVSNRAMITVEGGKTIYLDSAANGSLMSEGGLELVKLEDGKVAYQGSTDKIQYVTLTNPRQSKVIDVALLDGTHIWLNAGSSVRYPVPFENNERRVSVKGEAYFEVAHDADKPFVVRTQDIETRVLGTHFNVSAYDDEGAAKISLLEGSVKVSRGNASVVIKPGEQYADGKVGKPDMEEVMAWRNGRFRFDGADIEEVMRQVARWYDVEVVYESKPGLEFVFGAPRTMSAANVFRAMEETGGVHFTIEGRKVTVRK
jgi:transmembrane sensor